ncbi:MAG TPA: AEC family transporter [Thauera phenylacetica]|jgi:hypothetical protein|uniref:Permease n=1 Tax=Thauera phenylacetica B4P TaxID=1234382 RepID=N6Z3M4_9RHOO|nr:AEC family transporter [Thauera phenylacetica]ENO98490.1 permease [Thauera phenylacetica B4P]HRM67968.1 AEC family transporter [Thauera phenylacetica]
MLDILAITTPIFLIIGLGFIAVRAGLFSSVEIRVLGRFVIQFALPAMLFLTLTRSSVAEILNLRLLFAYLIGSLLAFAVAVTAARFVLGRNSLAAVVVGMGSSMSNSMFIGLPVVLQVLGPTASLAVAMVVIVENLLMLPLLLAAAETLGNRDATLWRALSRTLGRLLRNPMILAISAGFVASLSGLALPAPVLKAIDMLALGSAGISLFVVGGSLAGVVLGGLLGGVALVSFMKLCVHPLAVLAAVMLVPGIEPAVRMAAVLFGCMPMFSIYPILSQQYALEREAAAALVLTTVVSFFSITLWIWVASRSALFPGVDLR